MPSYKLHYFNARGRGEVIRLILTLAGQKFEDVRIEFADWPSKKKDYKFGQLPVLEIDGEKLNQSVAIMHYLASQYSLAGKTALDGAKCHAAVETLNDVVCPLQRKLFNEKDNEKKAHLLKTEVEPELKKGLVLFEEVAKETFEKSKTHHLVAGQLTYADLAYYNALHNVTEWLGADYIKQFPHLHKFFESIGNQPKVKEYVAKRPKTMF